MHVCIQREQFQLQICTINTRDHSHTVKDSKLDIGGEISVSTQATYRACVYEPAVQLPYQKHACTLYKIHTYLRKNIHCT